MFTCCTSIRSCNDYYVKKQNEMQYITAERKAWRDEIRKIAHRIQNLNEKWKTRKHRRCIRRFKSSFKYVWKFVMDKLDNEDYLWMNYQ